MTARVDGSQISDLKTRLRYVEHRESRRALKKLQRCEQFLDMYGKGVGLRVSGDTDLGKSTVLEFFVELHPETNEGGQRRRPVLYVRASEKATLISLFVAALEELGDSNTSGDSYRTLKNKFMAAMQEWGVRVIIIDEFQHLIRGRSESVVEGVAELLKELVNDGFGVVICGSENIHRVVENNPELERRFRPHVRMRHYLLCNEDDLAEIHLFIEQFTAHLPIPLAIAVTDDRVLVPLAYAGAGRVGAMCRILLRGLLVAIDEKSDSVTVAHLAEGYADEFLDDESEFNPFRAPMRKAVELFQELVLEHMQLAKQRKSKRTP